MSQRKRKSDITKKRAKPKKRGFWGRLVLLAFWLSLILTVCAVLTGVGFFLYIDDKLPKITTLKDYQPPIISTVYADDNRKIAEFFKERRIVIPLHEMPLMLIHAFIAAEDARFYKHKGVDLISIGRAFFKNIEAGTIVQGGSTITQQVTKSFFLTPERRYLRKIKEAILAYRIDRQFTKEDILFLYLNQIYLGHGAYGVQAAAENYFGKSVHELNLAECAMLAGLPQAPSKYSPFRNPAMAAERQIYVLNRMVAEGYITNIEATEAINTKLDIKARRNWYIEEVPFYTEHVRRYIEEKYGVDMLYKQGLQIYTAVNIERQKIAEEEIEKGLRELDKRQGYRGPLRSLRPEQIESYLREQQANLHAGNLAPGMLTEAVVVAVDDAEKTVSVRLGRAMGLIAFKDMRWARTPDPEVAYYEAKLRRPSQALKVGDLIQVSVKDAIEGQDVLALSLEQEPEVQGALLCMEAETGQVKAMVGGYDFRKSQFNRAVQSRRQPGSAFKPFIYAAALDKGYTPATVMIDTPIVFEDSERDFTWKPKNYGRRFHGPVLVREALSKSLNVVTVKILKDIGVDYAIDYAHRLGIQSDLSRDLSVALGSSGISLLETVAAYSVFANQGELVAPVFVTKIVDRNGNVLEEAVPRRTKVIEESTAYIMTSMLQSVVQEGTGRRVRALNRPVAGKTGTTNNLQDAWFLGFTPSYVTGTWVGFDDSRSLGKGETGSRAASPIWLGFMQRILADEPVEMFQVPEGVVFSKIDSETGLLPIPESNKTIFECFKEGTVPTEFTKRPDAISEAADFFKSGM